jgi:hypothetical protein
VDNPAPTSQLAPAGIAASSVPVTPSPQTQIVSPTPLSGLSAADWGSLQITAPLSGTDQSAMTKDVVDSFFAGWDGGLSANSVG